MEFHLGQRVVSSVFLSHLDGQGEVLQINMKAEGKKVCCKAPAPLSIFLALSASLRAIPGMPKASPVLKALAGEKGARKLKLAAKYGKPPQETALSRNTRGNLQWIPSRLCSTANENFFNRGQILTNKLDWPTGIDLAQSSF
jgi:hypothetical protein